MDRDNRMLLKEIIIEQKEARQMINETKILEQQWNKEEKQLEKEAKQMIKETKIIERVWETKSF
jgi:hypothetical protein